MIRHKIAFLSIVCVICIVTLAASFSCTNERGRPAMSLAAIKKESDSIRKAQGWSYIFKDNYVNVGSIPKTQDVTKAILYIENTTDDNQHIDTILTTCDCSTAYYNHGMIRPNAKDSVVVVIDLRNKKSRFLQMAYVYFNNHKIKPVILTVTGEKQIN